MPSSVFFEKAETIFSPNGAVTAVTPMLGKGLSKKSVVAYCVQFVSDVVCCDCCSVSSYCCSVSSVACVSFSLIIRT